MHVKLLVTPIVVATLLMLGCEANPRGNTPQPPSSKSSLAAPPGSGTSADVSVPPSSAASPRTDEGRSGAATGSTLTPKELNSQMPLPGEANDHSTPARAKQGDSTAPTPNK